VNLAELAITCYVYGAMTGYDDSLSRFEQLVGKDPDLLSESHRRAMLKWLNQWQCRQFDLAYHDLAAAELLAWFETEGPELPERGVHLWQLPPSRIEEYSALFDSLSARKASIRANAGRSSTVTFGPTAAAKILFALRPRFFVAWDEPIRKGLCHNGSGDSYVAFLLRLREDLLDLQLQCQAFGLELVDLPQALERPNSTPAQLLDEYYWATLTRGVRAPDRTQVAHWLAWFGKQLD
jgi:hypothetical protein